MDIEIDGDLSVHGNANGGSPSSSRHGSATGETRRIDQSEAGDGDEDGMDAEDGAPPKKKRRRPKNSCLPCQRVILSFFPSFKHNLLLTKLCVHREKQNVTS